MSTVRLPPDYYEHTEPPQPHRNWKRIIAISAAALLIVIAGLFLAASALLNTPTFRQYLIGRAVAEVKDVMGADIHVRDFAVHLSGFNPTVEMFDVSVDGATPYRDMPFLSADRLGISIRVDSFMRRTWYFSNLELDRPVAHIIVDEQGRNNLPITKQGDTKTDIFSVGVRHVAVNRGELYYNDRKSAIEADLQDLAFQALFDPGTRKYSGGLSYRDGQLHVEHWAPIVHRLEANFEATPDQFTLKQSLLTSGASQLKISATLNDYAHPRIQAAYEGAMDAGNLRQITNNQSLPVGIVTVSGSMQYQERPNATLLETLHLEGNMVSGSLLFSTSNRPLRVLNVSARYTVDKGNLQVQDMRASVLGGILSGSLAIADVDGAQQGRMQAAIRNIGLAGIQSFLNSRSPRSATIDGKANVMVNAKWTGSFSNLVAITDATLNGNVRPTGSSSAFRITGEVHGRYDGVREEISFTPSYIRTPQTAVNISGRLSEGTGLQIQIQSNDLREAESIVAAFQPMQPLGLSGTASFKGLVRGSIADPQFTGTVQAANLHVRGTGWRSLRADVDANPSRLRIESGELLAVPQGQLAFDVSAELAGWSLTDASPVDIKVNASQLDAANLIHLTGSTFPVTGTLSANVTIQGSQLNPSGQGSINLTQASLYNEPIDSATVNFQGSGEELNGKFALRMPAGTAQGNVTLVLQNRGYDGQVQANVRLDQLKTLSARNVQLAGALDLKASGSGTLDNPKFQLSAQVPQLQIQNQTINDLTLRAEVQDHVAEVRLNSQTGSTYVTGQGRVALTGGYDTEGTLDTSKISLQPLIAMYLPAQATNIVGQTEVHARVQGPLKDPSRVVARVTLPTLTLSHNSAISLSASNPIEMDYAAGALTIQRADFRGTGTDLRLEGTIPIFTKVPTSLTASGTIDLQIAQLLAPDVASSGQLRVDIRSSGTSLNPQMQGQIEIVNASFAGADMPIGLQNGNGLLRVSGDRIEIERFNGNVGAGTLTAQGGVTFRPSVQFNIRTNASGVRTLYPDGVRERVDANLTMSGSSESALLSGQVRLTELSFTPNFDMAGIVGQLSSSTTVPATGFAQKVLLNIAVQSTNEVNLVSSQLSLQGAANLQVRGTAGQPVITGRMNLTGGDLIFRGNRYLLQPSVVDFINPVRSEPVISAAVDTTIQQYDIHMRFRGTPNQLQTTYTSDPSLPPADIINLLVFGKTTEAAEAEPNPGNLGAESLIASSVSTQITNRVAKSTGISHLSVDPTLGDDTKDPGARVTLQQRVTGDLFVTFSTDVTGTERGVIKLEYQATPKVSLSGVRDQNGGFAVDMRIRKTW